MVLVRWQTPREIWFKLNTDEACKDSGLAGCGGVLRGSHGEWIGGFAKRLGVCGAYVAELRGLYEGLLYARELGLRRIEVDVDSTTVVNVISKDDNGSRSGCALVWKIRRLMELDWEV
ncbi:ribonuclease H protein, partial [Trifolium medium]|nr:ribonuclease H protein [Trifolium medium]